MKRLARSSETGATLVVSLIMLVLITLMILAALAIGSANFRTVTNMQFRDEAIAAANRAIDEVMSTPFALDPAATDAASPYPIDLDNDGRTDYEVDIAVPQCVRATLAELTMPSSVSLGRRWGPRRAGTRCGRSGQRFRTTTRAELRWTCAAVCACC